MSEQLHRVMQECSAHMTEIASFFKPGAEVTLLVRQPEKPEQDFMLTNDDLDEVAAMIERSKSRATV